MAIQAVIPDVPKGVWVVVLLGFNTLVNVFGVQTAARMNAVLLTLQMVLLAAFMVLGVLALTHGVAGAHLTLKPLADFGLLSPTLIFSAMPVAALSFLGFDAISTLSEEARGGPPAVARATILALILAAALFVAQTWLASLFVLHTPRFAPGDPTNQAFLTISLIVGGPAFRWVISIFGVLFGGVAAALVAQSAAARLLYGIVVSIGALTGFVMLHASVIVHFAWRGRSRQLIRHLVVPLIGIAIIGYVLVSAENHAKIVGLVWMSVGAAIMLALKVSGRLPALPTELVEA